MILKEQINSDLKQAMIAKNEVVVSTLRMLISAVRNKEISLRSGQDVVLSDEQIIEVLSSEIKRRKDSIIAYQQGNRQDLADKEKAEILILEKYMPARMSDEELEKIAREIIGSGNFGANDFGRAMGQVMSRVKGQADGGQVGTIIKKILAA